MTDAELGEYWEAYPRDVDEWSLSTLLIERICKLSS
jgi:hypothetical protein